MFEKLKAITIVRRMILDAESLIDQAKQEGYLTSNYYANAECALLSLATLFADVYTKKDKLGKAIVKESISGSWRQFFSEKHKQDYKNEIESLVSQYKSILQSTYSRTDLSSELQKMDIAFYEICKVFATHFYAEFNKESADYFMLHIINVKEYVYAFVGKK